MAKCLLRYNVGYVDAIIAYCGRNWCGGTTIGREKERNPFLQGLS